VLLYGPPGTGKSLLVRALANHFGVPLITVGADLSSKFYGETEARIRQRFALALKKSVLSLLFCLFFVCFVRQRHALRLGSGTTEAARGLGSRPLN